MLAAVESNHKRGTAWIRNVHTFDIPVQLPFHMQVLEPTEQFADYNGYVFLAKHSRFHLKGNEHNRVAKQGVSRTRSEHEPPEQYLMRR